MPRVSFAYPDARPQHGAPTASAGAAARGGGASPGGRAPPISISTMRSPATARPGARCGCMPAAPRPTSNSPPASRHGELPTLVALGDDGGLFTEPSKQLVNYRFVHGRFEVDKVLRRAALISGVGWDQVSVTINRRGGR